MKKPLEENINNIQEVSAEEAIKLVYRNIDRVILKDETMEFDVYMDQDKGFHLVLKSRHYNQEQLHTLYNTFYLYGRIAQERSKIYWEQRPESRLKVQLNGIVCEVDAITVASVLQKELYKPNDMMLMSNTLAWLHGMK